MTSYAKAVKGSHGQFHKFQMCVASPVSISFPSFNMPVHGLRALGPLRDALAKEVNAATADYPDQLVIQMECAVENVSVSKIYTSIPSLGIGLNAFIASIFAWLFSWSIASTLCQFPHDVPTGIHLCYGSPNDTRIVTPSDVTPTVILANAIARRLKSKKRALSWLHIPFTESTESKQFSPLQKLQLSSSTVLYLGIVFNDGHNNNVQRLEEARKFTPKSLTIEGISTPCGMGRKTRQEAVCCMEEMHRLAEEF
ncbi:hypothetical protein BCR33DRAFT_484065 [Rhizoclosmatium globosum]|uniref:Uncharacterized protein n=1 Tax=Rhizoclosmatium globosum TaxID=329046 RepID=A0A1Y2BMY1_9FUNG|nr:hypothetical protein BCR33DRAFT_484065 [Rhizoclosmatium globosum]|eukprot:ORY36114.1 hypothetical protein BCR33DRAFT_484065 [Rhizoclosmatium globosum]